MAEPIACVITLTSKQQSLLEQIVRRSKREQGLVNRARSILLAASGVNNTQIGQQLHLSRACVRKWRSRWQQESAKLLGVEAEALSDKELTQVITTVLSERERSGIPPTFTTEQVVQIVALACEDPVQSGRPVSHWKNKELAAEAVNRGMVKNISPRSVGRFLKRGYPPTSPPPLLAQC